MIRLQLLLVLVLCTFGGIQAQANIIGNPVQNFNPNYSQRDFVSVQSANTLSKNSFHISYFMDYASGTLPSISSVQSRKDSALYSSLTLGYGLTDWWDVGLSFPYILNQSISDVQQLAQFGSTGLLEIRGSTKFQLLKAKKTGLALLGHIGNNRTKRMPYVGRSPGLSYAIELSLDHKLGSKWLLALNAGYKVFNSGPQFTGFTAFEPFKNSLMTSLGARYTFNGHWHGIAELWSAFPDVDFNNVDRKPESLEALLALRYKHTKLNKDEGLDFVAGLTRGLSQGTSTPEIRVFSGLRYIFSFKKSQASKTKLTGLEKTQKKDQEPLYPPEPEPQRQVKPKPSPKLEESEPRVAKKPEPITKPKFEQKTELTKEPELTEKPDPIVTTTEPEPTINEPEVKQEAPKPEAVARQEPKPIVTQEPKPITEPKLEQKPEPELTKKPEDTNILTVNNKNIGALKDLKPAKTEFISFENINFYFDSYVITKKSFPILRELLRYLNKKAFKSLEIWGHTDSIGKNMYNEKLSLYRANAVYKYLIKKGIPKDKMKFDGWGERKPVVPNTSPKNRYRNRRVEFIIRR